MKLTGTFNAVATAGIVARYRKTPVFIGSTELGA